MVSKKIIVVTGANKGIGYGIVENLAQNVDDGIIYLTARNPELGKKAVEKLIESLETKKKSEIIFHQLDITDEKSVKNFANHLEKQHGGLDVLVNNAGFAYPNDSTVNPVKQAEETIGINYYGTKLVSKYLIPLIHDDGRIVNVCSQAGYMNGEKHQPNYQRILEFFKGDELEIYKQIYERLMSEKYSESNIQRIIEAKTTQEIDDFVEDFKKSVKNQTQTEDGFPKTSYRVSKAAEIALTLLHHRMYGNKITINACCPGYVNTDMTGNKGPLTIQEGADTPSYLAIDPEVPKGKFVFLRQIIDWY